jgi:GR25 family glycosyltransferase involved in LPS biosynthesis
VRASPTRIKLIGDWCPPDALCREWDRMSQGGGRWNGIEVTDDDPRPDAGIDFYVIVNRPWPGAHYVPERTIVFQMEPWCPEPYQTWGVKTWGEWATPDPARFLQVRAHRTHLNNAFWQLKATYDELRTQPVVKTRTLSSICSPKYFDPGHIKRVDFLRFLEAKNDDVVRVDVYAYDNPLGFRSWVGPHPPGDKDAAIFPYRYFFAAENNRERNFITEKLWEPLLAESLCFYWGAPNAAEWIDPRAFIAIDLNDFEHAFATMKAAILGNEWERRIDVIRQEKRKVLERWQFFPTLERILHDELRLPAHPGDTEIVCHKYFPDALGATVRSACFVHAYVRNGDTKILDAILTRIEASGLLDRLDRLYVIVVGDETALASRWARHGKRIRLIDYSCDASRGEAPTLDLVRAFASMHQDARILYLHTKGASHQDESASVADWRALMLHFLVDRHVDALAALDGNDAVGCNLLAAPHRHFSGNFWWADARYLASLPPVPPGDRHAAEWWLLGRADARARSLHDSGVDHYRQRYPARRYAPAAAGAPAPASICLVMIVKDEAHVVEEALASLVTHIVDYVVVDTGSTDGTQQVVTRFFAAHGIAGQVFERPWRDFGANRSEALALAREHSRSDYLWMFDADDVLEGEPALSTLTADAYHVHFGPDLEYVRLQIFRRDVAWRYVGVLHEYPACDPQVPVLATIEGDYRIHSRRLGSRSRAADKYARDAALLEAALAAEPDNARYAFYLAQSRFDAGQHEAALDAYRRRAEMGGWAEEVFYSRYRAAQCLERLARPFDEVRNAYEACFDAHPHRAEPLVRAAAHARVAGRHADAYALARRAAQVDKPASGALFVEPDAYAYRAQDEQAIAAYWCGFHQESFALCSELLERREIEPHERARIECNRDYAVSFIKDAFLRHDAALVARLAARVPPVAPRVTLTVTSCRRLQLFIGTVWSFLNACTDIDLVDRFVCVDDNSSADDRAEMRRLFPFFEFVLKGPEDKGHAKSLALIRETVRTPWLVHLEDDWHFFARRAYIGPAIEILEENPEVGQVLFNRNYAETLEDRDLAGGARRRTAAHGYRYVAHEHYPFDSEEHRRFQESHRRRSNAWWPHYSLRPAVVRTRVFERVGPFDARAAHFEHDYAQRYVAAGFSSCFFDGVYALHTGRLTSERGDATRPNAYALNDEPQFGGRVQSGTASQPAARPRCRVKLVGNWADSAQLAAAFLRQSKGGGRWDEIEITTSDAADCYVLFNQPGRFGDTFVPERTIVFPMEPSHAVARWGEWAAPDPRRFLQVRGHDHFPNCGEWHIDRDWATLHGERIAKSADLSAVVSSKFQEPGQALRIGFLRWLEAHAMKPDIYGYDNIHGLHGYRGSLPPRDKSAGLVPYRYTLAVENSAHANYFTEKVLDAILAECVPFYWGCPNLDDYLDPRAFIRLPLEDFEASRRIVEEAIASDEWSRRIEAVRSAKRRILDELQLFPTLARVVRGQRFAQRLPARVINLARRPDRLESFRRELAEVAGPRFCARVERVEAIDGRALTLTPEIRHLFRENDFGYRRSFVGCALSHLALWQALAASDAPGFIVFEDDVTPCRGFEGQLIELCAELEARHPAFDVLLLGSSDWRPRAEDDFERSNRAARPRRFEGENYLGGTFAYVISRTGAQRLLAIVERDGIQNGIDRFVHRKEAELELLIATPHIARTTLVPPGSGQDSDIQNDFEPLRT